MFDKNFYPTSKEIAKVMIEKSENLRKHEKDITILEPSAGKGDILDAIMDHYDRYRKPRMFAIEKNVDLQAVIREKGYYVIGTDFLVDDIQIVPDVIIMNPPFDHGAKHLLRAYEILAPGGEVVCLLNSNTLTNICDQNREQLRVLIEKEGDVTDLGQCFKNAERMTNVNTSMVVIRKGGSMSDYFQFEELDNKYYNMPNEDDPEYHLAVRDVLLNREHRFNAAVEAKIELTRAYRKYRDTVSPLLEGAGADDLKELDIHALGSDINGFVQALGAICWQKILNETKLTSLMTSEVKKEFKNKFQHQRQMAFSKNNIISLLDMLFANKQQILDNNLLEVFDHLTRHHEQNREGIEGWATNDAYKVNRKVIFPHMVEYGKYYNSCDLKQYGDKFSISYSYTDKIEDIDRAMCYLTGEHFPKYEYIDRKWTKVSGIVSIKAALQDHFEKLGKVYTGDKFENKLESHFFKIKFFKKGTIHLEFKDITLWQYFNMKVAEMRGFPLPEEKAQKVRKKAKAKGFGIPKKMPLMLT